MDKQPLRRTPQQARSQQRVEEILYAASDLLVEEGYEGLTTSAIARRAGISVGSLYQFFANKEAVLQALAQRYLEKMTLLNETIFTPDAIYVPIPILIERTIDSMVMFVDKYRGFHQLFNMPWVLPELQTIADSSTKQMIVEVQKIIQGKTTHLSEEEAHASAQILIHMMRGLLPMIETADSVQRPILITEFKRMSIAYLEAVMNNESSATLAKG